jgi:2-succinyl-5-enolpyruvyl-6-hydroxy-3-cyclohexene-1-carboxylate synthase
MIPPILRTPTLHVTEVGIDERGWHYIKMATTRRSKNPVREVVIRISSTAAFEYLYSIYDETLERTNTYRGPHGDPEKDEWL